MRIAVTNDGERVSAHFGQCESFTIFELVDNEVVNKRIVPNNTIHGGGGCVTVDELLKHDINHVIAGGMGMGAQQKFANAKVSISSFSGSINDAINAFKNNNTYALGACKEHGDCH